MTQRLLAILAFVAVLLAQGDRVEQARREFLDLVVPVNDINLRRARGIQPTPDADRNPKVQVIDCAQSSQSTEMSAAPKSEYWNTVDMRLKQASITPAQVQVVAFLATLQFSTLPFPKEPRLLENYTTQTLN